MAETVLLKISAITLVLLGTTSITKNNPIYL